MLKRKYAILVASAGTRLNECVDNIENYLGRGERGSQVVRVTDHLRRPSLVHDHIELGGQIDIRELMTHSRPLIEESWNDAILASISRLPVDSVYPTIACHLTTFDIETKVFCTPGLITSFFYKEKRNKDTIEWRPSRVVILIDDIYDMYADLSRDGDVLGREARVQKVPPFMKNDQLGPAELAAISRLDADVSGLKTVLAWRRAEMTQAENLATQLDVPLICLGTKHSISAVRPALRQTAPLVCYISHPITRYRRELADTKSSEWNQDTHALNEFSDSLSSAGLVAVMPTAIDELRFDHTQQSSDIVIPLAPRWPRISTKDGLIGYPRDRHGRDLNEFAGMQSVEVTKNTFDAAKVYLRTLEALIYDEIPFRDHFLVNNCQHLLVFRPRADGADFSGGVKQEIAFWKALLESQPGRRMAVVHTQSDLAKILNEFRLKLEATIREAADPDFTASVRKQAKNSTGRIISMIAGDAKSYLRGSARSGATEANGQGEFTHRLKMKYNEELAEEVLYRGDLSKYEGPLLEAPRRSEAKRLQLNAWRNAVASPIERSLTYLDIPRTNCRVFVFDTLTDSEAEIVSKWLMGDDTVMGPSEANLSSLVGLAVEEAVAFVGDYLDLNLDLMLL